MYRSPPSQKDIKRKVSGSVRNSNTRSSNSNFRSNSTISQATTASRLSKYSRSNSTPKKSTSPRSAAISSSSSPRSKSKNTTKTRTRTRTTSVTITSKTTAGRSGVTRGSSSNTNTTGKARPTKPANMDSRLSHPHRHYGARPSHPSSTSRPTRSSSSKSSPNNNNHKSNSSKTKTKIPQANLRTLIYTKNWDAVITKVTAVPYSAQVADRLGDLPLHEVCLQGAPFHVVKACMSVYPDGARKKGFCGRLPLHNASYVKPSLHVIKLLLKEYPDGAGVIDADGRLPLHLAVVRNAPKQAIQELIAAYPKGLTLPNKFGNVPYMLTRNTHVANILEEEERKPRNVETKISVEKKMTAMWSSGNNHRSKNQPAVTRNREDRIRLDRQRQLKQKAKEAQAAIEAAKAVVGSGTNEMSGKGNFRSSTFLKSGATTLKKDVMRKTTSPSSTAITNLPVEALSPVSTFSTSPSTASSDDDSSAAGGADGVVPHHDSAVVRDSYEKSIPTISFSMSAEEAVWA